MRLSEAARALSEAGVEDARAEARLLFRRVGGVRVEELVGRDPELDSPALAEAVRRRCAREPLQYILGRIDFYREGYEVGRGCLIPRPDTELLVEYATAHIPAGEHFIDLCTGSGCVAISTLQNTVATTAVATDISTDALAVAERNRAAYGLEGRLTLLRSDALGEVVEGEYFAVLSNPPYVTEEAYSALDPELYFEPRCALVGIGDEGAGFYETITEKYKDSLKTGGFIAYEIGYDQGDALEKIAARHGMSCEIIKDYSGHDRVAVLKK